MGNILCKKVLKYVCFFLMQELSGLGSMSFWFKKRAHVTMILSRKVSIKSSSLYLTHSNNS